MIAAIFGLFIFSTVRGNLFQPATISNRNRSQDAECAIVSGRVGVSPAGFGILPKQWSRREPSDMDQARRVSERERVNQSFQVRDRETRSPAGETPTLPENFGQPIRHRASG